MAVILIDEETPTGKLKVGFWGDAGTGKTEAMLTFPRCVVMDGEDGATNYKHIRKFAVIQIRGLADFHEAIEEIRKGLKAKPGRWETVCLDPITVVRDSITSVVFAQSGKDTGSREYAIVNRKMRDIYRELTSLGLHVVITARESDQFAENTGANLKKTGVKADIDKGFKYFCDYVLHFTKPTATTYKVEVVKARALPMDGVTGGFIKGKVSFESNYAAIAKALATGIEMDRGGDDDLNRDREAMNSDEQGVALPPKKSFVPEEGESFKNPAWAQQWVNTWLESDPTLDQETLKTILSDGEEPLQKFGQCKLTKAEADGRVLNWQAERMGLLSEEA